VRDEALCESCGNVIGGVVDKYGGQLTMLVEDARTTAGDSEITLPRGPDSASATR